MSQHLTYEPTAKRRPQPDEVVEESPTADELARPSGPAAAVLLAAGLASFTLGLLSVLTAASSSVSDALAAVRTDSRPSVNDARPAASRTAAAGPDGRAGSPAVGGSSTTSSGGGRLLAMDS